MKKKKILVIEDESSIRLFLKVAIETEQYEFLMSVDGESGLIKINESSPDVIIVDIGLPGIDGFEVIRRIREKSSVPIIVLTVHDLESEKVRALDLGADDYLTKPFSVPELMARLRACLRRKTGFTEKDIYQFGSFIMNLESHKVEVMGNEVRLTATEFNLLKVLVRFAGKVVTHQALLNEVWGPNSVEHVQYLRVYLGQIRKKLRQFDESSEWILTEPGVGYRWLEPS